jgi:hypothetical protein
MSNYPHGSGNGSGEIAVHQQDMGGWVRVFTDLSSTIHPDLHIWLSHALTAWFRARPQLRMRNVVSVTRSGDTVEMHAWYDLHVFPDLSGQNPKPTP